MTFLKPVVAALSIATLLASCADGHHGIDADEAPDASGPYDAVNLRTLLDFAAVDGAFATDANFRIALSRLGENCTTGNLRSCIARLQAQNNGKGSAKFDSLGGIPTHAMLEVAESALKENGSFKGKPKDFSITGEIRQKCLDVDETPGYEYKRDDEELTLCVRTVTSVNKGGKKLAIEMLVKASSAKFDTKDLTKLNNVFPEAGAATGIWVDWGTAAGFQSKLYAKGTDIIIEKVWVDKNYDPQSPDFELVPETGNKLKKYQALYDTYAHTCIDMMFSMNEPPRTLPSDAKPPYYCLGRCKDPMIINTH